MKPFALSSLLGLSVAACESTAPAAPPPKPAASGMPAMEAAQIETLQGVVREVLTAGHYTYVSVEGQWAVVLGDVKASPGAEITLAVQGRQTNFHSSRLDRDFELLFFAST